jgi:hypothetical protein
MSEIPEDRELSQTERTLVQWLLEHGEPHADSEGRLFGVFVFSKSGYLAGLEVWSIDGLATPIALPEPSWLTPAFL